MQEDAKHRICDSIQNEKLRTILDDALHGIWFRLAKLEGTEKEEEKIRILKDIGETQQEYNKILENLKCPVDRTASNTDSLIGITKALIEHK